MNMPPKIWAAVSRDSTYVDNLPMNGGWQRHLQVVGTPYIRADRVEKLVEALTDAANRLEAAAQNAECGFRLNHVTLARWAENVRAAITEWEAEQ